MSRLIVKNLPKAVTEDKIREIFREKGSITDIQLKYTKDGKFRQFGFVGYEKEESAQEAVDYFNNTFINTSKVTVELCAALGDEAKPKSWSKYAKDSETYKKKNEVKVKVEEPKVILKVPEKKKGNKIEEIIGDHKNDPQFLEFMKSHSKDTAVWDNDMAVENKIDEINDGDKDDDNDEEERDSGNDSEHKLANKEISDLDYMKVRLMNMKVDGIEQNNEKEKDVKPKIDKQKKDMVKLFTVKVRNIPKKIKREELIKFFRPSKAYSVRIPGNADYAYIGFKIERDLQRALLKDRSFLNGKQLHVYDFTSKNELPVVSDTSFKANPRWQQQEELLKKEESICESGKLFFRNLAYTVSEDDVQKIFEVYGDVVEVNIPIDSVSRKIKGFGTVTFMMPEHAVKAYTELNGTLFHGRMFHIMPGKTNDNEDEDRDENSTNFKDKKERELKKSAGSSHNWNTLFLGANAVAEVLSKTYGRSKEEILDSSAGGSNAAVRLALGETQIILEMKKFLEDNNVHLAAFDNTASKRSKKIILAKNLPACTDIEELREMFAKFGLLENIILPPSGVTCLIHFADPSEARKAFKKLAYSKFKHVPLYLEWAPENTFKSDGDSTKKTMVPAVIPTVTPTTPSIVKIVEKPKQYESEIIEEEIDDTPPEENTTLFIRNLNFLTVEDAVRDTFKHLGGIHIVRVARKKDPQNPKEGISLGYGFIQFKKSSSAEKALKTMQFKEIEGKQIELKRSDRTLEADANTQRKPVNTKEQKDSTKIMVRNIPFQANAKEVRDIFKTFGEIKALRLPKKMTTGSEGSHRGFGFVDFMSKSDAKNAFEALHYSTHLYGRRLVLEWADAEENVEDIRKRTAEQFASSEMGSSAKKSRKGFVNSEDFIRLDGSDNDTDNENENENEKENE